MVVVVLLLPAGFVVVFVAVRTVRTTAFAAAVFTPTTFAGIAGIV